MSDSSSETGAVVAVAFAVRYLLELGALAAVAYWGMTSGTGPLQVGLTVGGPVVVATAWSAFWWSPWRLPDPWRFGAELVVFGLASAALVLAGRLTAGAAFAAVALTDEAVLLVRDLR